MTLSTIPRASRRPADQRPTSADLPAAESAGDGVQPHPGRRMTEDAFVAWAGEKTRAEWVEGEVIVMATVSLDHDKTAFWARSLFEDFTDFHGSGSVHGSEVMVRLRVGRRARRRLPDVAVILKGRSSILKTNVIDGAPYLIVEVASPGSVSRDWQQKYLDYAKAGVKEYWVIDRLHAAIEAYALRRGETYRQVPETDGKLASVVLKGFYLRPEWVLGNWRTSRRAAAKELGIA